MKIVGLQKVSLIDFPERLAATVFLAGCNLACSYCHNQWMIAEQGAPETMTRDDLLDWLEARHGLLDGVCVSGGEPTVHPELPELLAPIQRLGYALKLDTNGTRPAAMEVLMEEGLLDYVAMDLKAPLDARYEGVCGRPVDLSAVRRSMALLRAWGGEYELRTTVAPGLDEEVLREMAALLDPGERWVLQPCVASPGAPSGLEKAPRLSESDLQGVARRLQVPGVRVRGVE